MMLRTIIYVVLVVIGGKVIGFMREMLLAQGFGASRVIDEFLVAESVMVVCFGWVSSFAVVFTPVYKRICVEKGELEGDKYFSILILFIETICFFVLAISFIFDEYIIGLSAPGFSDYERDSVLRFFYVIIWSQLFIAASSIMSAYLTCNNKKVTSSFGNLCFGVAYFLGVAAACIKNNSVLLGWGVLVAHFTQAVFLFIICYRSGSNFVFSKGYFKEIIYSIKLSVPVFVSTMIADINVFFDKMFASMLNAGVVSVLHYASRIQILFSYTFSMLVQTVFFPDLADLAARGKLEDFKGYLSRSLEYILIVFVPLTVACWILANPIIRAVYAGGMFETYAVFITAETFSCYSLGLLPIALKDVFVRSLYAMQMTTYSFWVEAVAVGLNVLLNLCMYRSWEHVGLSVASSLSVIISVIIYAFILRRQIGDFLSGNLVRSLAKIIVCSSFMGLIVFCVHTQLEHMGFNTGRIQLFTTLLIDSSCGIVVYVFCGLLLGVENLNHIVKKVMDVWGKRNPSA